MVSGTGFLVAALRGGFQIQSSKFGVSGFEELRRDKPGFGFPASSAAKVCAAQVAGADAGFARVNARRADAL